jgi:hypothetical protein
MIQSHQAVESYYTQRIAELNAEVKRLRTNIIGLQTYAEERTAKYEAAAEDPSEWMSAYFRGKSEAYADMVRMACVAYVIDSNTEGSGEDGEGYSKDDGEGVR